MMKVWLIPISLALLGGSARADECAARAEALLATVPKVIQFCEPCGDQVPGPPVAPRDVEQVSPAYLYMKTDATRYRNVAALAGCPIGGVSPSLKIESETVHGVMITPDTTELPIAVPPQPPLPALAHVHVWTPARDPWPAIVLAVTAGVVFGSTLILIAFGVRRRRAMRPRAVELR